MKTYFRILKFVKPYWKHLSVSILCTILYALLNGASVYLTIPLLDTLFQESAENNLPATLPDSDTTGNILPDWLKNGMDSMLDGLKDFIFAGSTDDILMKICVLILLAFLGKNLFGYLQAYFLAFAEQGVIKDLRNAAYQHLHRLPMSYFKGEKTGNLISRIMNDVTVVQQSVSAVFLNLIREPLTIVVFLGIAISISWELTIFSALILPFSILIISWIGLKLRKHSRILQEKMADLTTILHETISGVKVVKSFGMEEYENRKFGKETKNYFQIILKMVRIRNSASPLTEFLSVVVGVVIVYYGGKLVLEENVLKASEFLGFLFAIFQLMPPIKELSGVNNRIQESSAAGERIFEILDTKPNIIDSVKPVLFSGFNNSIEFRNVYFKYDDSDEMILDNINFKVNKGEIIAIVGSSGAGKTTLVDLIPRFFDPDSGSILIDGIDIKEIKITSLRKLMGIVTQETVLFNESIRNNIAYGIEDCSQDKIIEAAKVANAHQFIMEISNNYDVVIGERGTKLSGGQRQRLSIARALLKNPPIMIFDEATSALDSESEVLVQQAIERLMHDRTTFVIAHRLSTIRNSSRILVLDKGHLVQEGSHDELLKDDKGIYKKLYEFQFRDQ